MRHSCVDRACMSMGLSMGNGHAYGHAYMHVNEHDHVREHVHVHEQGQRPRQGHEQHVCTCTGAHVHECACETRVCAHVHDCACETRDALPKEGSMCAKAADRRSSGRSVGSCDMARVYVM